MGKHNRDNETDGQWPEDKPLPKGRIFDPDDDDDLAEDDDQDDQT